MKLVIKVGTQSILSHEGAAFEDRMFDLAQQICSIKQLGHDVVLVSSGAVSSGRKVLSTLPSRPLDHSIGERQLLASLGQPELMLTYRHIFKKLNVLPAQILLTKHDFQTRKHYLNITRLFQEVLNQPDLIPIVNENDSVSVEELMFTDNDELAGLIAAMLGADKLIILSNVDGVFSGHPDEQASKLIPVIKPDDGWPEVSILKNLHGRGGMHSKLKTAREASSLGITIHIANINEKNILKRLMQNQSIGTTIYPKSKKSNIKRWIAYNKDKQSGSIYINDELEQLLKKRQRALSILPVGLVKFKGTFRKGDVVEIRNLRDETIGVGLCRYDDSKLKNYLGENDQPVFIHYNHLHIY